MTKKKPPKQKVDMNTQKETPARARKSPSRFLEEDKRLNHEILARISHELRTPLTSIIGFAETMLLDQSMTPETTREFTEIIRNEGERLSKLVNNLIDLSRIEHGDLRIDPSEEDLVSVLDYALTLVSSEAAAKSITVHREFSSGSIFAWFDREKILQVIVHLLGNAVKFTPSRGNVWIGARVADQFVEIRVRDNGRGISTKDLPQLFQKFRRAHRPGEEIQGAGIGLAIAKHLIELHGGTITVESKEQEGSTFVIQFPRGLKADPIYQ